MGISIILQCWEVNPGPPLMLGKHSAVTMVLCLSTDQIVLAETLCFAFRILQDPDTMAGRELILLQESYARGRERPNNPGPRGPQRRMCFPCDTALTTCLSYSSPCPSPGFSYLFDKAVTMLQES